MAESTKQATNAPVKVTQDTVMPTVEQKTPEQATGVGQVVQETEVPSQQATSEGLPEDSSERTKREFEKLREQLRQERELRLRSQGFFEAIPSGGQAQPPMTPLYDPATGLLNEQVFSEVQQRAAAAEERAKRAELAVQTYQQNQVRADEERQRREAIAKYPELDSESKNFDKNLHIQVRRILTDNLMNPEDYDGKTLTYAEAADLARGISKEAINQAKKEGATEAIEQLTPKEQASLEAVGSPHLRQEVESSTEDLRARTRKGDLEAIVERLKGVPVVGKG